MTVVDIHSHLLPGIDDGAKDLEEAVSMAGMAADDGSTDLFLTSHLNLEFRYDPAIATSLRAELAKRCPAVRLHSGCEVHVTMENVELVLKNPAAYTLGGKRYLLVELPERYVLQPIRAALERLSDSGLRLVVAHPERNSEILAGMETGVNIVEEMVEWGCLMQITARSLTGGFGPAAAKAADRLLRKQLVHFVASDGHSVTRRRPLLSLARAHLVDKFGPEVAELLTRTNGLAILNDSPVKYMPRQSPNSFWSFVPKARTLLGLPAA